MRLSSSLRSTVKPETCYCSEITIHSPKCNGFWQTQNVTILEWSSRTKSTGFASLSPTQVLEFPLQCGISSYATSGLKISKASIGADLICRTSHKTLMTAWGNLWRQICTNSTVFRLVNYCGLMKSCARTSRKRRTGLTSARSSLLHSTSSLDCLSQRNLQAHTFPKISLIKALSAWSTTLLWNQNAG